MKMNKFFIDC